MGGCASKPKELKERTEETAPVEQPAAKVEESVAAAAETTPADDKKENSVSKDKSIEDEAPLVDLSKPEESENKETIAAVEAVPVLVLPGEAIVVENPKGETIEVEVAAKEGEIIYVEAVKETKEEEVKDKKEEEVKDKEEENPKTAPAAISEDKNEETLVKV